MFGDRHSGSITWPIVVHDLRLLPSDCARLSPGTWMNDELVNAVVAMVVARSRRFTDGLAGIHANPHFVVPPRAPTLPFDMSACTLMPTPDDIRCVPCL